MRCEHCGKNEVSFVFRSSVNGKVTEKHLCSECAEKLGYTQKLRTGTSRMMQNFMRDPFFGSSRSFFGGSLLDDFFGEDALLPGRVESPLDDFFREMPALTDEPEKAEPPKEEQKPAAQESHFARMRKLNALKAEQKKAIRAENFERAAELRDEIHRMEANGAE